MPDIAKTEPGWYCFKALPKKEHIAAQLLKPYEGIESFCPRLAYMKNTRRGKVRFVECLFPGYVFLNADLKLHYRLIKATQGIKDVVSFGNRIPVMPEAFIEELKERLKDDDGGVPMVEAPGIKPGMEVTILEGPLRNFSAIVSADLDAHQRVALLLDFLGRQMEVKLPQEDVLAKDHQPRKSVWPDD